MKDQLTFLSLFRAEKSTFSPLERQFEGNLETRVHKYPSYLYTAALAMREIDMEIINTEKWDMDRITIRTFARCVAGLKVDEGVFNALDEFGLTRMADISAWFTPAALHGSHTICELVRVIIEQQHISILNQQELDTRIFPKVFKLKGIGPGRASVISQIVAQGVKKVLWDSRKELYISKAIRCSDLWQDSSISKAKKGLFNLVVSDGSNRTVAAFGVVNEAEELVIRSSIPGRATSQRAECFGLLAACVNATRVGADPKFIIDSISRVIDGVYFGTKWLKLKNRSIIRKIARYASLNKVKISWMRGHQDHKMEQQYVLNRAADREARAAADSYSPPLIGECWEWADQFAVIWKGNLFEGDIRSKAHNLFIERVIRSLDYSSVGKAFSREGCWEETIRKADIMKFNTLLFKMSTNTLPVHAVLLQRWPGLFNNLLCPMCNEEKETLQHLMNQCSGTRAHRDNLWEEVLFLLSAATDMSAETITYKDIRWIPRKTEVNDHWYLAKIPAYVGKWVKKNTLKDFQHDIVWNAIRSTILNGIKSLWEERCDRNEKQGYTYAELKRLEEEWAWRSSWHGIEDVEEEIWEEELGDVEVDDFVLEEEA